MTLHDITAGICKFLKDNILAPGVEVSPDQSLANLGVDSFSLMEVVLFIERRFGLVFPLEELTPEVIESVASLSHKCSKLINSPS